MYDSIKDFIDVSYSRKPFVKRSGTGSKVFGAAVMSLCYPVSDTQLITDVNGAEVISTTQLYVPGTEDIHITDNVIFEGVERPIQRINTFYRKGRPDIKVVYL